MYLLLYLFCSNTGRGRHHSSRLSFPTRALFQPKKPTHALPKIQRAFLRLYRTPLPTSAPRAKHRRGGANRLRVTINYHVSRSSPAIPIRQATSPLNKHGWETLDVTDLLLGLQRNGERRRRLSLSIVTEVITVPNRRAQQFANTSMEAELSHRPISANQVFSLETTSPSTVPLLTVYLVNETGKIEDLVPHIASRRREKRMIPTCESTGKSPGSQDEEEKFTSYCRLQKVKVNFAEDLKWHEILTPKELHANDCSGSCEIPIGTVQNNGVLRHWYWQYPGAGRGTSPLTCSPTRFSSVTILSYINEVFELLPFPDMAAIECGCV